MSPDEEWARSLAPASIWRELATAAQRDIVEFAAMVRRSERAACYQAALDLAEKGDGYDIAAAIRARGL